LESTNNRIEGRSGGGETDIDLLHLRLDELRKLEASGISTLEQIALMSRYDLGLGKNRGDQIVQAAQNILANRHFTGIHLVLGEKPRRIEIKTNRNDQIFAKIIDKMWYLSIYDCTVRSTQDGFVVTEGPTASDQSFETVMKQASLQKDILDLKAVQEDKKRGITLPREDIVMFARKRGFDHFWRTAFEEIRGNELMKISLACTMFSSSFEPIHTLIVGDPASAKTMAKDILSQNFSAVRLVGANSTKAGLVINRTNGEPGALSFSDGHVVVADEFDKIPAQDIDYTLELLSNGKCRVDSGRVHETIESHFSMIAMANPVGQIFAGQIPPVDQIGLPPALMSRFALIVRAENVSGEEMEEIILSKLKMSGEIKTVAKSYDQWIKLAREHQPAMKATTNGLRAYSKRVRELIEKYHNTPLRRDARMGDYSRRVPMSLARSEFRDVSDNDLEKSLSIFEKCLSSWS
jgi:DNA replicative helicase MCM subunit Mcm2 (Cdc46/Mcm family)